LGIRISRGLRTRTPARIDDHVAAFANPTARREPLRIKHRRPPDSSSRRPWGPPRSDCPGGSSSVDQRPPELRKSTSPLDMRPAPSTSAAVPKHNNPRPPPLAPHTPDPVETTQHWPPPGVRGIITGVGGGARFSLNQQILLNSAALLTSADSVATGSVPNSA